MLHLLISPGRPHRSSVDQGTKSQPISLVTEVIAFLGRIQIIRFLSIPLRLGVLVSASLPAPGIAQATSTTGDASATVVQPTSLSPVGQWVVGAPDCSSEVVDYQCAGHFVLRNPHDSEFSLNVQYKDESIPNLQRVELEAVRIESNIGRNATTEETLISIAASPAIKDQLSGGSGRRSLLVQISYH